MVRMSPSLMRQLRVTHLGRGPTVTSARRAAMGHHSGLLRRCEVSELQLQELLQGIRQCQKMLETIVQDGKQSQRRDCIGRVLQDQLSGMSAVVEQKVTSDLNPAGADVAPAVEGEQLKEEPHVTGTAAAAEEKPVNVLLLWLLEDTLTMARLAVCAISVCCCMCLTYLIYVLAETASSWLW
mmetsp:Transcript_44883/g.81901  ORF Transcript_44883/g.81901 Transcript_44883/m.81901 type:complete len:182 (-) Transcript_44883:163-708(-)